MDLIGKQWRTTATNELRTVKSYYNHSAGFKMYTIQKPDNTTYELDQDALIDCLYRKGIN